MGKKPISKSGNPGLAKMVKTAKGKKAVEKMGFDSKRMVAKKMRGGMKDILGVTKALPTRKVGDVAEGGPGSGRPTKAGSAKDIENRAMKAADDANAKMDAAEKAMKKK